MSHRPHTSFGTFGRPRSLMGLGLAAALTSVVNQNGVRPGQDDSLRSRLIQEGDDPDRSSQLENVSEPTPSPIPPAPAEPQPQVLNS